MNNLYGYRIQVKEPKPRMTLSTKVIVSAEFRESMNRWMLEFFGYQESLVPEGQVIIDKINNVMYMSAATLEDLKSALPKQESTSSAYPDFGSSFHKLLGMGI
jgi:hypothetical protein